MSPGCLVELLSAGSTSKWAEMGNEGEIPIFRETISTKTDLSEWEWSIMKQQWLYAEKCQYMICNVIGGLRGKCQAELSNRKCQPVASSRWFFPGQKPSWLLVKRPWVVYMCSVPSATLLFVSLTSYIAYIPIYSWDKQ